MHWVYSMVPMNCNDKWVRELSGAYDDSFTVLLLSQIEHMVWPGMKSATTKANPVVQLRAITQH